MQIGEFKGVPYVARNLLNQSCLHGGILGRRARGTKDGKPKLRKVTWHTKSSQTLALLIACRCLPSIRIVASRAEIRSAKILKTRAH